jgi:hypothetical protein
MMEFRFSSLIFVVNVISNTARAAHEGDRIRRVVRAPLSALPRPVHDHAMGEKAARSDLLFSLLRLFGHL